MVGDGDIEYLLGLGGFFYFFSLKFSNILPQLFNLLARYSREDYCLLVKVGLVVVVLESFFFIVSFGFKVLQHVGQLNEKAVSLRFNEVQLAREGGKCRICGVDLGSLVVDVCRVGNPSASLESLLDCCRPIQN